MVELALNQMHRTAEVEIHIEKRLPVQGGLGAGSGNAVAALVGFEAELNPVPGLWSQDRGTPATGLVMSLSEPAVANCGAGWGRMCPCF